MKMPTALHGFAAPHPLGPYNTQVTLNSVLRHVLDKSVRFQTEFFDWTDSPAVQVVKDRLVLTERFK